MSATAKKPTVKKTAVKAEAKPAATAIKETAATKPATRKTAAPKTPKAAPGPQLVPALTHEQIAKRADELWASRGYTHGNSVHDWWQAEQELKRA
jgi:hypothetical protein